MAEYTMRESDPPGRVLLLKDGETVFSDREYRGTADHALKVLRLGEGLVGGMYADYRADAEERGIL